jgi:hypothetical protein
MNQQQSSVSIVVKRIRLNGEVINAAPIERRYVEGGKDTARNKS